jgi:hypothetical protein
MIDQKRGGETEQRLDWQEYDLPAARYGAASQERPELLSRLVGSQVQVVPEVGHAVRLLPGRGGSPRPCRLYYRCVLPELFAGLSATLFMSRQGMVSVDRRPENLDKTDFY